MGFLDNSGDIILDAVLTETGRKRLATGNVLEAFTQRNANINYGLVTIPNKNLLYMPSIKRNEKIPSVSVSDKHNVIYLAVSDGVTYDALVAGFGGLHGGGPDYVLESNVAAELK